MKVDLMACAEPKKKKITNDFQFKSFLKYKTGLTIEIQRLMKNTHNIIILLLVTITIVFTSCRICSQSGIRYLRKNKSSSKHSTAKNELNEKSRKRDDRISSNDSKTVIKMEKKNGVYQIPVEINGVEMSFIFDTGAGLISISQTEATFLYKQGKLDDEDFIGTANFTDANGDISEGTIIMLDEVKIGNKTITNIKASVVHNMRAPLLIGQSALEKFGKISIDYDRNVIIFE